MSEPTATGAVAPAPAESGVPTPATAVAVPTPEAAKPAKLGVGDLPPALRASLHAAKVANAMNAEIAKLSWGKSLDSTTAGAIAEWGRTYGVDVITEMDILGNRPYLNSKFYLRKLAALIERGIVEYAVADHIEVDHRLEALAASGNAEAVAERDRRTFERIRHSVGDDAISAVVFRVKLRSMDQEVVGCKRVARSDKDPVGAAFPVETAESRAARRCIRLLVGHVPELDREITRIEGAAVDVEAWVERDKTKVDALVAEHRKQLGKPINEERAQREYAGEQ